MSILISSGGFTAYKCHKSSRQGAMPSHVCVHRLLLWLVEKDKDTARCMFMLGDGIGSRSRVACQ